MITERLFKDAMGILPYYQDASYNPYVTSDEYKLPNCTTYACGRLQEQAQKNFKNDIPQANAKNWYQYWKFTKQEEPVPGSVLVFTDSGYGHLIMCESVTKIKDNVWNVVGTDSSLDDDKSYDNPNYFRVRNFTLKVGEPPSDGGSYVYVGCCVNPYAIDKRCDMDNTVVQLEVYKTRLRVRTAPSLNAVNYGQFAMVGYYNVIETQEDINHNIWCKLDDQQWCMVADGYSRIHQPIDLRNRVKELEEKVLTLNLEVSSLKDKINKAIDVLSS